ncbi:aminopeptidase P N-terminal domain-containing protein [Candidatus Palauibacter soopunensis]|uniref:aminopeptidase P N-terminal domain-containing protein n=1 Tax=Candidatus Palauibacter soopunensis TaxID=3056739 RepID=UPI002390C04F|nr:aminopeptidase P N-terminal domain-containing protein [Candidatus Palauibacter soopunensis]MDE2878887.1 aminopeptidase P N-terminal domain-containing protein [Candidatus Palauibacter soopunensis]
MMSRRLAGCLLAGSLLAAAGVVTGDAGRLSAQTPEQRYSDWVRPGFRPQEYEFRRNRILDGLRATGGGLLLVPSSDGITHGGTFRQLENFWYLTGLEVPQSMLVLDAGRDVAILFMPQRDPRFENPGRPNDFPGRPLLEDYQIRGIGGADDYRDIAELEGFVRERVRRGEILRVNAGAAGEVPDPVVPPGRESRPHGVSHPAAAGRPSRGGTGQRVRDRRPPAHGEVARGDHAHAPCGGRHHGRDPGRRRPRSAGGR